MENAAASALSIVLPKEYPLILLACCILCIECFLMGMIAVAPARFSIFNKEYMNTFEKEHAEAFPGTSPATGGFPDCGEGRYAQKLPYKDWVKFNNAMRVHMNFVEQLPMMLSILVLSGLFLPKIAMYCGFILAGARAIYAIMYLRSGSDARKLGAIAGSLPLYLLAIAAFVTACTKLSE